MTTTTDRVAAAEAALAAARDDRDAEIAGRYAQGESSNALAREYGLTRAHIHNCLRRQGVAARPPGRHAPAVS